jgi:AcrR family transcriptional regulator
MPERLSIMDKKIESKDSKKTNQRVKITKKLIKNAMQQLATEKSFEKITIYELCQLAEVNRSTFYKYYGSQYDVLNEVFSDYFTEIEEKISQSKDETYVDGLISVLKYTKETMPATPLNMPTNPEIEKKFAETLFTLPVVQEILTKYISGVFADWEIDLVKTFFITGAFAIIRQWLVSDSQRTAEELAELIVKIGGNLLN